MKGHRGSQSGEQSPALPAPTQVGRYRVVRALRAGGMATVYEAVDEATGRLVALKVLHPALRGDPTFQAMLRLEALIASIVRHRGVVPVLGVETYDGSPALVAELLEGVDLSRRLAHAGPLPVAEALAIAAATLDVLTAVHEAGVAHGDLKPSNLFLVRGAVDVRVLDFGVAQLRDDVAATVDAALAARAAKRGSHGTPGFMPPEQIERPAGVEPRSDLFAVGVTLYECLTRRRPFRGDTPEALLTAMRAGRYTPVSALRPDAPAALDEALARALRPRPEERHPTAEAMADALREALAGVDTSAPAPAATPPAGDATPSPPTPRTE